jgi:hypothetical protein
VLELRLEVRPFALAGLNRLVDRGRRRPAGQRIRQADQASYAICSEAVPRGRFAEGGGTRLATASLLQSIEGRLYE